jgi:hypothetical protein
MRLQMSQDKYTLFPANMYVGLRALVFSLPTFLLHSEIKRSLWVIHQKHKKGVTAGTVTP